MARPMVSGTISSERSSDSSGADLSATAAPGKTRLTPFEQGMIDVFVRLAAILGVPKSVGEIYGLLFASARPLAFQDIADRLEMSKGSASQGLRLLRITGAVRPVYMSGDRRDHFVAETELRALLTGFLKEKVQPHFQSGTMRLGALRDLARDPGFGGGDPEEVRTLRSRIDKLNAWHKRGKAVVPWVTKFFG